MGRGRWEGKGKTKKTGEKGKERKRLRLGGVRVGIEERGRTSREGMRTLLLRKRKGGRKGKKEEKGGKEERGTICQTASYAPVMNWCRGNACVRERGEGER